MFFHFLKNNFYFADQSVMFMCVCTCGVLHPGQRPDCSCRLRQDDLPSALQSGLGQRRHSVGCCLAADTQTQQTNTHT